MTGEESSLQEQLRLVKYRIKLLNMIEDRLIQMKGLATYARDNELGQEEIVQIQASIDQLAEEIRMLDKGSQEGIMVS